MQSGGHERAPFTISSAESPRLQIFADSIPACFPLCRKTVEKLDEARKETVDWEIAEGAGVFDIDKNYIAGQFEDAVIDGVSWESARLRIGGECGLLDIDGRPVDDWAANLLKHGKKAYDRAPKYCGPFFDAVEHPPKPPKRRRC
jgi:hypothetical protein